MSRTRPHFAHFLPTALALCLGQGVARAELPPTQAAPFAVPALLNLATAREIALRRNWDVVAAQANVDQAIGQEIVSHEFPNPTATWSTTKINLDAHPTTSGGANDWWARNYDTIFALNQLYEIGGKRSARQRSAHAGYEAARAAFLDARRTLELGVSKAYISAVLAGENERILQQSAKSLQKEADIAQSRLQAGDISAADKGQIEIAADRLALDAEAAANTAYAARVALEVLLGAPKPMGSWRPRESLRDLAQVRPEGANASAELRPDLLAAESTLRKTMADLALQRALRIPDPTFLAQYEHEPPDQPNTGGLGLSFPLPIWNRNRGNIKAAEANVAQAVAQLGKVRTQIASDLVTAAQAYAEAGRRLHRYEASVRPRAAEVLETVRYAYKKGGAALVDLLQAERNDNDIRLATAQAMADSATAAVTLTLSRSPSLDASATATKRTKETHVH